VVCRNDGMVSRIYGIIVWYVGMMVYRIYGMMVCRNDGMVCRGRFVYIRYI